MRRITRTSESYTSIDGVKDGLLNFGFGRNCLIIDDNVRLKSGLEFKLPLNNSAYESIDLISKATYDIRDTASSTNMVSMDSETWSEIVESCECVIYPNPSFDIDNALQTISMFADKHWDKPDGTKHTAFEMLLKSNRERDIKTAYYLKGENFVIDGLPDTWVAWKASNKGKHLKALKHSYVRRMFQATYPGEEPPGYEVTRKKMKVVKTVTVVTSPVQASTIDTSVLANASMMPKAAATPKGNQKTAYGRSGKKKRVRP